MNGDAFDQLAPMFLADNALYGAMSEAEQQLQHLVEGYTSIDVMTLAWSSLSPSEQEASMETLLNSYYQRVALLREQEEIFRRAREAGHSYLEHDDLEIIEYSLPVMFADDGYCVECEQDGHLSVPLGALARLVQEVKLLRARLEKRGDVS